MKKIKLPLKILLGVVILLLAVIIGYVIYVFAAYYRVEDNQILPITAAGGAAQAEASAGEHSNLGTLFFAVGFSVMLALDVALG